MMKLYLDYYTEFKDNDGHMHYAVHKCRKTDKFILSMRDYKFPGLQYKTKGNNMADTINPNVTIDTKPKYDGNLPVKQPSKYFCVYDKSKRLIAKLRDEAEANEYKLKGMGEYTVSEEES